MRVFSRDSARGIFISASPFTSAAVKQSTDALGKMVSVLCELEELVCSSTLMGISASTYARRCMLRSRSGARCIAP